MAKLIYSAITSLVDEIHRVLHPIVVGGGKRALPDDALVRLELMDERRFANGVVYIRDRTKSTH